MTTDHSLARRWWVRPLGGRRDDRKVPGTIEPATTVPVPGFRPFNGVRYDSSIDLAEVTAPPYDVIDDDLRSRLASRHSHNVVRVDLPIDADGLDRYQVARRLLEEWERDGTLRTDEVAGFYIYRMDYTDQAGRGLHTHGVIGALELSPPGQSDILPHERTTPKARSDRLEMLRSCRMNLSPIWALSLTHGLSSLLTGCDDVLAEWRDEEGVGHTLTRATEPEQLEAIASAVEASPVVIADGHHRYETSLAYRDERRAQSPTAAGGYDRTMAFVVELVEDQLDVRPIHRLISGLPDRFDLAKALGRSFEVVPVGPVDGTIERRMLGAAALALVDPAGEVHLLRPRPESFAGVADLDSSRLDHALSGLPSHRLSFQHGVDNVLRSLATSDAQYGVLLRPATVAQIEANAQTGVRMPPKTTFFFPKPKTGLVFRRLG